MKILVTGAAGFIGFHLCRRLLKEGCEVVGLDNINDYYSIDLKFSRLSELGIEKQDALNFNEIIISSTYKKYKFIRLNLEDNKNLKKIFEQNKFDIVCNLAAQAGVRYSIENPEAYISSNITGFFNVLECCRIFGVQRFLYASSSSVYGDSSHTPFHISENVDKPLSLYAATKKSNELMAHTYSHLYKIQSVGLRFFTVYGPWGRPDMAMYLFTEAIFKKNPIKVFNEGNLSRDFTYIDDIVNGVAAIIRNFEKVSFISEIPYKIYNIGRGKPERLLDFIETVEKVAKVNAKKKYLPMQPGDVSRTSADIDEMKNDFQYLPKTGIEEGVTEFIQWYEHYNKQNLQ